MAPRSVLVLTPLIVVLSGCGAAPSIDEWLETGSIPETPLDAAHFPSALRLLDGLDEAGDRQTLGIGDRALFGVELHEGDEIERWLMLFEVTEDTVRDERGEARFRLRNFTITPDGEPSRTHTVVSRLCRMRVARFEAAGDALGETEVTVPRDGLCHGIAGACELSVHSAGETKLDQQAIETFSNAMASMLAVFEIVQNDALLADILWRVVQRPSLWSIVTSAGVEVNLEAHLARSEQIADSGPHGAPVFRFPITITANGEPALYVLADVTEPTSPLNVVGGTLALRGVRPGDESTWFTMRLLAARRPDTRQP